MGTKTPMALVIAVLCVSACGGRSSLVRELADGAVQEPGSVDCPGLFDSGLVEHCKPGEICGSLPTNPNRYCCKGAECIPYHPYP